MSDDRSKTKQASPRRVRDSGMTLPELMIAFTIMGLIVAVISGALTATLRQQSSTEGRLNVARSEQAIGLWLPGDLASAGAVSDEPAWSPCAYREAGDDVPVEDLVDGEWEATGEICPSLGLPQGSNALMLGWSSSRLASDGVTMITTYTNVSYYFYPDGDTFSLARIECVSEDEGPWSCEHMVVLRDLDGPPPGTSFIAGQTVPSWVLVISQPAAACPISEPDCTTGATKDANRIIVTINGGGRYQGAGGGENKISITAGGTTRKVINGSSMSGAPSFVEARSLCGGPIILVIDESNSIGNSNGTIVRNAVKGFVNALRGTPVRVQIIGFHTVSHTLGTNALGADGWRMTGSDGGWGYNMADDGDVDALVSAVNTLKFSWSGNNGGTNWEEGLYRALLTADGLTAEPIPGKVVFFTDGVPTFDRLNHSTGTAPSEERDLAWPVPTGSAYSQVAFNRADAIARQFRGPVDLIGVGIGGIASGTEQWIDSPATAYRDVWYRAYRQYQRVQTTTVYEKASTLSSNLDFERYSSGWTNTTPDDYFTYNTVSSHTSQYRGATNNNSPRDDRRIYNGNSGNSDAKWRRTGGSAWQAVSYNNVKNNLNLKSILGLSSEWYRVDSWTGDQGQVAYNAAPAAEKNAGLWRQRTVTTTTWVTKAEYEANNTTSDGSDGWTALANPEYVSASSALDWVEWTGESHEPQEQFRSERILGVPADEADGYVPAESTPVARTEILRRLVGEAVPAAKDTITGEYSNADQATLYSEPDWDALPAALKAIALGDCGGTLTLQTRLEGSGAPAPDPFRYQATQQFRADGTELQTDKPVVFTNREQTTGNFDLDITSGLYRTVVIIPEDNSSLQAYQPRGWTCRAGAVDKDFTLVNIPGAESSPWKGIRVTVNANEAVSCTQTVTR